MAFYRTRNYRAGRRVASRRRRGPLTTRRIFSRTSAKSQANQIYALRKRVSSLNRKLRPDVKVLNGIPASFTYNSGLLADIWNGFGVVQPSLGTDNGSRIGDKIYVKSLSVQMYFEYYNNSTTGYHDTESSGATVRVFVVQYKGVGASSDVHDLSEFIENPSNTGAAYNILPVKPFMHQITQDWKVLYNKCFTMTAARNQKLMKFSLKPGTIRFDDNGKHNYIKVYTIVSGLHFDNDFKEFVQQTVNVKMAYTDL